MHWAGVPVTAVWSLLMPVHHRRVTGYVCGDLKEAKFSSQNAGARAEAKSWDKFPPTSTGGKRKKQKDRGG